MTTDGPTIPTIRTDRGEWLRWDLARSLSTEVSSIREELADLQERFSRVMRDVRRLPGGEFQYQRIDAYPGTRLDRDMGAGVDADGWLAEVAEFLEGLTEAALDEETPAERRAALIHAMEGGTAAPEDFGLDDATDCDGFSGGNAWGPCAECGRRLEDHDA